MRLLLKTLLFLGYSILFSQNIDCLGSSITKNGYPQIANDSLIANGYGWRMHNYGVPGAGVIQNAYINTPEYKDVVNRKSEIVILLLGVGDWELFSNGPQVTRDLWELEYRKLVDTFMKNSKVYLGLLIHRVVSIPNGSEANATIDKMNLLINKVANEYGISIIDFKSAIGVDSSNFWASDGIHPNNKGSELLGIAAYKALVNNNFLYIDEEYWNTVEDYKEQKSIGWFGCDRN